MNKTPKVLFLSRGDASRAQIAEGFFRVLANNQLIPFSAGTDAKGVSPLAVEAMSEVGIDISTRKPEEPGSLFRENFQYVVALCDESRERYPLFPFTPNLLKWSIRDPEVGTDGLEARKQAFRQVRDQIRSMVNDLVEIVQRPVDAFAKAHAKAA
jgi:arsenate reductase